MTQQMDQKESVMTEAAALQELMETFLAGRLEGKLKNESADKKKQTLIEGYKIEAWLDNKSSRVKELTLVTHAIKYQNPDAKGSSLYAANEESNDSRWVSTASIKQPANDVVGNTAALDVYKFLQLSLSE